MTANPFQEGSLAVLNAFAGLGSGADRVARDFVYLIAPAHATVPEGPDDVPSPPHEIPTRGFSDDYSEFERSNAGVEMQDALMIIPTLRLRKDAKAALDLDDFRPSDEDSIKDVALDRTYRIRAVDTDVPRANWYLKVQA